MLPEGRAPRAKQSSQRCRSKLAHYTK